MNRKGKKDVGGRGLYLEVKGKSRGGGRGGG